MDIFKLILILLCAYLIGSLPFGYMAGKLIKRVDLRREGSKNVGATNVFRVVGTFPAIAVLFLDICKGFLSIHLPGLFNFGGNPGISYQTFTLVRILAGLAAIAGHNWTIFLKFRGGKGVATCCGVSLGLALFPALVSLAIFIVVTGLTRFVSLGSMFAVLAFPLSCVLFRESLVLVFFGSIVALVIILRHKANIKRLIAGTENRIEWLKAKERISDF